VVRLDQQHDLVDAQRLGLAGLPAGVPVDHVPGAGGRRPFDDPAPDHRSAWLETEPEGASCWSWSTSPTPPTASCGFSGRMRRRVGIAQALLNDPELLRVPEPTSGLDPEERIRFRILLSQLAERRTVLLSAHIADDVAQTCTELAVLGRGRLIRRLGAQPAATTHEAKRDRPVLAAHVSKRVRQMHS
jgi:hypothetical protein